MKKQNRDLLVLFKQGLLTPHAMDREVNQLHEMLYDAEKTDNLSLCYEVIDVNTYKTDRTYGSIVRYLRSQKETPFVFLNCLN